mmetsp:Transcript_7191/g.20223  ORF Transcript_7191/g.20223 Transcript_7191/m.20223 type:complete len:243 (-) Transcript_7191:819-1547(-)
MSKKSRGLDCGWMTLQRTFLRSFRGTELTLPKSLQDIWAVMLPTSTQKRGHFSTFRASSSTSQLGSSRNSFWQLLPFLDGQLLALDKRLMLFRGIARWLRSETLPLRSLASLPCLSLLGGETDTGGERLLSTRESWMAILPSTVPGSSTLSLLCRLSWLPVVTVRPRCSKPLFLLLGTLRLPGTVRRELRLRSCRHCSGGSASFAASEAAGTGRMFEVVNSAGLPMVLHCALCRSTGWSSCG